MIRILFTIPNFDTAGSGKALLNLALGLDKSKFEPHICCKTDEGSFFETVKNSGIPVHIFNYEAPMRPVIKLLRESWNISKKLREIKPDIIHSFHYNNNYGEALAARLAGIKWIFTKKNMNWGSDGANAWKIRSALANHIIIQNSDMQRKFYPNSKKTTQIERGINTQYFSPNADLTSNFYPINTPADARIIVSVANLSPIKGIEVLIHAFAKLADKNSNWHLWLVGKDDNDYAKNLRQLTKKLGLQQRIQFLGKQQDVRPFLQRAELFVLPTAATGEGSPVALIEAMAMAKIVFGTNVPGIKDQLKNVPNHLFAAGNVEELTEKMATYLLNDTATNALIGQSFRQHAVANYTIAREVREHEEVYEKINGKKP